MPGPKQVAVALGVSPEFVRTYVQEILRVFGDADLVPRRDDVRKFIMSELPQRRGMSCQRFAEHCFEQCRSGRWPRLASRRIEHVSERRIAANIAQALEQAGQPVDGAHLRVLVRAYTAEGVTNVDQIPRWLERRGDLIQIRTRRPARFT